MVKRRRVQQQPQQTQQPTTVPYSGSFLSLSNSPRSFQIDDSNELPTRNAAIANQLIDLVSNCPEVATALEVICAYALSSSTGDEMGFTVTETEDDSQPETVAIARDLVARTLSLSGCWQAIWRSLAWGDAFAMLDIDTRAMQISRVLLLPTWQTFRIEDIYGNMERFEQRMGMNQVVQMHPLLVVHWRYNRRYLYGRSLFREALSEWAALCESDVDVRRASREATINPNIHTMPPGSTEEYKGRYRDDFKYERQKGIIPDIFLMHGGTVSKPSGAPTNLPMDGLIKNFNLRRLRIAMRSRVPLYLLGIDTSYAREIATQPMLAFLIFVGSVRQLFSEGLRQIINTELALKGIPPERWLYEIRYPTISANPYATLVDDDVGEEGVSDVDG